MYDMINYYEINTNTYISNLKEKYDNCSITKTINKVLLLLGGGIYFKPMASGGQVVFVPQIKKLK